MTIFDCRTGPLIETQISHAYPIIKRRDYFVDDPHGLSRVFIPGIGHSPQPIVNATSGIEIRQG